MFEQGGESGAISLPRAFLPVTPVDVAGAAKVLSELLERASGGALVRGQARPAWFPRAHVVPEIPTPTSSLGRGR